MPEPQQRGCAGACVSAVGGGSARALFERALEGLPPGRPQRDHITSDPAALISP
jgi:hypothetical protein